MGEVYSEGDFRPPSLQVVPMEYMDRRGLEEGRLKVDSIAMKWIYSEQLSCTPEC